MKIATVRESSGKLMIAYPDSCFFIMKIKIIYTYFFYNFEIDVLSFIPLVDILSLFWKILKVHAQRLRRLDLRLQGRQALLFHR